MKTIIFLILLSIFPLIMIAEHYDYQYKPKSLDKNIKMNLKSKENIGTEILSIPNIDSVLKDDEKQSNYLYNRFGIPIKTTFNLENSGTYDSLSNGDRIWRLRIVCPNAFSLNFTLFNVFIPENCRLFIYDENYKRILGAITNRHNKKDKIFDTDLIDGESAIFEYFEPADCKKKGYFEIGWVVYGLNPALMKIKKEEIKGTDKILAWDDCRRDVNCSEGDEWCKEKRSVVKFWLKSSQNESYYKFGSSGVLLNDLDISSHLPYIFTSSKFYDLDPNYFPNQYTRINFSFYNDECGVRTNSLPPIFYRGATYIASWNEDDGGTMFALVQMMEQPDVDDKIYYAPWSYYEDTESNPEPQPRVTVLHHPEDDKMNISIDANLAVRGDENNSQPPFNDFYWVINAYHDSFSNGSEGAPFFNSDHKVIAQMEEFFYPCAYLYNGTDRQTGGRFSKSWLAGDNGADYSKSLHHWLAPNWTSGDLTIEGKSHEVNIYGRNFDEYTAYTYGPDDLTEIFDDPNSRYYVKYYNIDVLNVGSGHRGSPYGIVPFITKLKDDEPFRYPITVDLVSSKLIRIRPCTKIIKGTNLTAKIKCDFGPIAESYSNSYSHLCDDPAPLIKTTVRNEKIESTSSLPLKSCLYQNKPNPFSESTDISYYLSEASPVRIAVFNSLGIQVAELVNLNEQKAGRYTVKFKYSGLDPGVYFYTRTGMDFCEIKKMMVIK